MMRRPIIIEADRRNCLSAIALLVIVMVATLALFGCDSAFAITKRSAAARAEFKRAHPCPATGKPRGACPGYIIDHIQPLCDGGADNAANMQWQTKAAALEKDKAEWKACRAKRRGAQQ